ncbi:MAG: methyltransferase [Chlorobi bacterium]|nr:methyltransferase [Chlorobiota bacterium]
MTSKERVLTALEHKTPDKLPVDFGATPVTGIHVRSIENLRNYYGLEYKPVKVTEPYQMLGEIEDDLAEILGIDTVPVSPKNNMFGFPNENWKEFKAPWGQVVLVPEKFNVTIDDTGDVFMYPEGDTSVAPCAKMPANGFFFDALSRQEPVDHENLNVEDNLEEFAPISGSDLDFFKTEVDKAYAIGKAVVANFGGTAFGDIALVPGMQLKHPKGIRDVTEWYMATVMHPDYVMEIFEKQSEIALENLKKIYGKVGNKVDVVFICGTDFGTQTSQFCDEETLLTMYGLYYRKINDWIHQNTTWKTFKHSCGAVEPFMKDFIDLGFDIINPVQVSATGMDPQHLKDEYGKDIVFWGGGVDTQNTLPFGTPEEVEKEVLKHCEIFSKDGGFVFNTVHNIQATVPVENIVAMINALKKFNGE